MKKSNKKHIDYNKIREQREIDYQRTEKVREEKERERIEMSEKKKRSIGIYPSCFDDIDKRIIDFFRTETTDWLCLNTTLGMKVGITPKGEIHTLPHKNFLNKKQIDYTEKLKRMVEVLYRLSPIDNVEEIEERLDVVNTEVEMKDKLNLDDNWDLNIKNVGDIYGDGQDYCVMTIRKKVS